MDHPRRIMMRPFGNFLLVIGSILSLSATSGCSSHQSLGSGPGNSVSSPPKPAAPTLGTTWAPSQQGYGEVRPRVIFNGGDPTGLVQNISWTSWGGEQAL